MHPTGERAAPAWQPGSSSPKPASRTSAPVNRAAIPWLLKLQTGRALTETPQKHRQDGLRAAQKAVSPPSRHQAEARALPALCRAPPGTPAGRATRGRSCRRGCHREAESGATHFVERPCPQVHVAHSTSRPREDDGATVFPASTFRGRTRHRRRDSRAKPSFRDASPADAERRCASKPNRAYQSDVSVIAAYPPTLLNAALALPFQTPLLPGRSRSLYLWPCGPEARHHHQWARTNDAEGLFL